jgi:hypothetical protein
MNRRFGHAGILRLSLRVIGFESWKGFLPNLEEFEVR